MKGGGSVSLTAKEEKYVQGLVAGLSQRQSYLKAYPNSDKWKPETVDNKASALYRKSEVLARFNELMDEHKAKALWTREEAVTDLIWLKEQAKSSIELDDEGYVRQGTSGAYISAIQELNKLEDLYPSNKTDLNVNAPIKITLGDYDDDD